MRTCPISKKRCDCVGDGCPLEAATRVPSGRSPDEAARDVVASVLPFLTMWGKPVMPMRMWVRSAEEGRVSGSLAVPLALIDDSPGLLDAIACMTKNYMPLGTIEIGPGREPQVAQAIRDGLAFAASMAATSTR